MTLRMNKVVDLSRFAGESLLQEAVVLETPDMMKPIKRNTDRQVWHRSNHGYQTIDNY